MKKKCDKSIAHKIRAIRWASVLILFGLIIVFVYGYVIEEVKNAESSIISDMEDDKFEHMCSYLEVLHNQACSESKEVSTIIENELTSDIDLEQLRKDLESGTFNQEVYEMIRSTIEGRSLNDINNYKNGIIIMTTDGVYEDLSYGRAITNEKDMFRTWDFEIKRSYNPKLTEDAINKILNHSDDLILSEPINYINNKNHQKISDVSYDALKTVYKKEGIEGFKNYQIYVPTYITDTGDIFGQNDIVRGVKQPTYKFIVVQEFNLYDQIKNGSFDQMFDSLSKDSEHISAEFHYLILVLYLLGFCYTIALVVSIFHFSFKYNSYVDEHEALSNK